MVFYQRVATSGHAMQQCVGAGSFNYRHDAKRDNVVFIEFVGTLDLPMATAICEIADALVRGFR